MAESANDRKPIDPLGDRLINLFWRKPPATLAERTRRRISVHLIPYLFFLYILAYLDRVNVSVAALRMTQPESQGGLGFPEDVIGFGFGLFFWGYWILEVPSTLSVVKWGARWVFVRILVLWGIMATLMGFIGMPFASSLFSWIPTLPTDSGFVQSIDSMLNLALGWFTSVIGYSHEPDFISGAATFINGLHENAKNQFYLFRFMLGFFEGGFFPSVIVYLSLWFKQTDRAKAIASFMIAIPLSSALGLPLSGQLLKVDWFGLDGWRWVFILEGILPVIAGFTTLFLLPNRPHDAKWLPEGERTWLVEELDREHRGKQGHGHWAWVNHLGMVLLLTGVYFGLNVTSYGLSSFMPSIIKSQSGVSDTAASVLASLPFVMGFLAMLVNAWHSDKTNERPLHVGIPLTLLGLSLLLAAGVDGMGVLPVIVMIVFVGTFMYSHLPAFWPIPTLFLGAAAAASAIGFINMVGNLGGSVGPTLVGNTVANQATIAAGGTTSTPFYFGNWDGGDVLLGDDMDGRKIAFEKSSKKTGPFEPVSVAPIVAKPGNNSLPGELIAAEWVRLVIDKPVEREQKLPLAFQGAYASALRKLAPWPIASAIIVLVVSYLRKRSPVQKDAS